MAETLLGGGCQCGGVRYRLVRPATATYHCHCSMCRRLHGALFATFSTFPAASFSLEAGRDELASFASSDQVLRYFCRTCGCQIYATDDRMPGEIFLATGTLHGGAHPGHPAGSEKHMFVGSKVPWYEITDELPQSDEF